MVDANSSLGNVMTRLGGLKNVSRRRVMPGAEFIQDLEPDPNDISEVAGEIAQYSPTENLPQADMGGEITPQSYDVRANTITNPEEEESFFSRMGKALGDYFNVEKSQKDQKERLMSYNNARNKSIAQSPPIETAQVEASEGLPPVTASQQEASPGFLSSLSNEASKPYEWMGLSNLASGFKNYLGDAFTPKLEPEFYEQHPEIQKPPEMVQQQAQKQELDQNELDKAQMQPWQVAVYGATDAFANSPELISGFKEYTGIDFDQRQKEMTEKYEKVLSDIEKGYNDIDASYDEQEQRIKQRIMNNQSTDSDKYFIGLALLMPLLVGALFGKEAGFGALGGAAKGFADILGKREKNIREDEDALLDLYKQRSSNESNRGNLELEKLKVPEQVKKNLPKDEFEDLKGMNDYTFTDPKTGEVVASGPQVLPDLYMDLQYGNTAKKRENMQQNAVKLEEEKAALERANQATSDVIQAAMQLKDPGVMSKILAYALSEDKDGALKKVVRQIAPDIMVDGRKQNSAVYIDSKIEQIKDAYRRNEQMRAFTNTVAAHIGAMAENPAYSGLKPTDLIDQMLILRDRGQQFFVDRASAQGFLRQPLENKFGQLNRKLYSSLNQKEENSQLNRDKQLMNASE